MMVLRRIGRSSALAVAASAFALAACSDEPVRRNVILIVVDTLRADHLSVHGYRERMTSPALEKRAADAVVFDNFYSTSPWTLPAMASLYTGHLPTRHKAGMRIRQAKGFKGSADDVGAFTGKVMYKVDSGLPTLGEELARAGYVTGAVVNNAFLTPTFGLDRGFDHYDYSKAVPRTADVAVDAALEWLGEHAAAPFFFVVHLYDPHDPYSAPPPFGGRFAAESERELGEGAADLEGLRTRVYRGSEDSQAALAAQVAAYDEEIAFVDQELERLFQSLSERGLWDNTVVVFTSDHGEGFYEHSKFGHGNSMFDELLHVPLIVWAPGVVGGRRDTPASMIDIMPTVLDVAGVERGADLPGQSLWGAIRESSRSEARALLAERLQDFGAEPGEEHKAIIRWPFKTVVNMNTGEGSLFDLAADPGESVTLVESHDQTFLRMVGELQDVVWANEQELGQLESATLDEETLERLRALGYVGR